MISIFEHTPFDQLHPGMLILYMTEHGRRMGIIMSIDATTRHVEVHEVVANRRLTKEKGT